MHDTIANQLEQDGYAVLEEFLRPAECDELFAAGLELTKKLPDSINIFSTTDPDNQQLKDQYFLNSNDKISYFYEKDAIGADGNLKVDPSISLNKVGHALHLLQPIFRCYTYSDRVKAVCRQIGFSEPAVVQSMYIYKNPGVGGEVVEHQDITFLHTEPIPPIGFWIALEDATIQNGCLWVARGSHKSGVHRRLLRDSENREKLSYDRPAAVYPQSSFTPVPVSKGTCILIHGNVVHKSAPNRSSKSRHAYTFHVIEKRNNTFSPDNWLQEGENAPFVNLYTTNQME
ncbi:phytanoyl-CoA dioxygenase domain containing 1 [Choristoneura fumiferana]|uniref:phytanoyl-CoA dioxygenase domain containing 1 n=1 Tax=Choristoneura fumiferana TaxID=7141 RepID=UPI003D1562A2